MMQARSEIDRDLADLPPEQRWRAWMGRIEAVLFASARPVSRADLGRVVGQVASLDLLIADLAADLETRPYEVVRVAEGWMLRTRPAYAPAIRAAADASGDTGRIWICGSSMSRCWPPSHTTSRSPAPG